MRFWWPFGEKPTEVSQTGESKASEEDERSREIILYQSDLPHERARKIFQCAGMRMNLSALSMIPGAADAIAGYQKLDQEAMADKFKDKVEG